ncbi:MAG: hypothetical protein ACHQ2Z_02920 [Elusimicrobiota bacterium]
MLSRRPVFQIAEAAPSVPARVPPGQDVKPISDFRKDPAKVLTRLKENMKEVVALCLEEAAPSEVRDIPDFVGTQMIEVRMSSRRR